MSDEEEELQQVESDEKTVHGHLIFEVKGTAAASKFRHEAVPGLMTRLDLGNFAFEVEDRPFGTATSGTAMTTGAFSAQPPREVSKPVRAAARELVEKLRANRDSLPNGI